MELGDRPVERALAWLFGVLESGAPPKRRDIEARFSAGFLDQVGPLKTKAILGRLVSTDPVSIRRLDVLSPFSADLDVARDGGEDRMRVRATVEPAPPHRFTGLRFSAPLDPVGDWDALREALAALDACESSLSPAVAERIVAVRDEAQIPGLAAGIVRDGRLVHRQALGAADLASMAPVRFDSVFRAASITKVVTALGLGRLAAEGALALDDPVGMHLTSFRLVPQDDTPITIRHVLTHTGGLPRHKDAAGPMSMSEHVGGELRAVAPAGRAHVYSNLGFGTLGQVIADVTGRPYGEWVTEHVLRPAGMRDSLIELVTRGPVRGYEVEDCRLVPADPVYIVDEGAGALSSTVADLGALATLVCDGGGVVCPPEMLAELTSPQAPRIPAAVPVQGLGFVLDEIAGRRVVWHNGGLMGWASAWYVVPDERLGVALLATRSSAPLDDLARELLRELLG